MVENTKKGKEATKKEKRATYNFRRLSCQDQDRVELYAHTLHRYPNCTATPPVDLLSLNEGGHSRAHVTLISLPPQSTIIIVGPAHCTNLCKDEDTRDARLPACCCTPGDLGCRDDVLRCGDQPTPAQRGPSEVVVLCGEWETGPAPQAEIVKKL